MGHSTTAHAPLPRRPCGERRGAAPIAARTRCAASAVRTAPQRCTIPCGGPSAGQDRATRTGRLRAGGHLLHVRAGATCCTAGRPMQRSWPRAERQTSCWSPSASRKKCTLGRPARPCFSRSAPWRAPRAGSCQGQGQQRPHRVATSGRRRTTQSPYGACVHRNACTGQHALGSMRAEHVATEALTLVSGVPGSGSSASRSPTRWSTDAAVGPGAQHT